MNSRMIVLTFCVANMAINFAVYGNKITSQENMFHYVKVGAILSYILINNCKFDLLLFFSMICVERISYYNKGADLDFAHYGRIFAYYTYWYFEVDERSVGVFLADVKKLFFNFLRAL